MQNPNVFTTKIRIRGIKGKKFQADCVKKQLDSFHKSSRKKKKILIDLGIFKNRLTIRERCDKIINVVS